MAIDKNFLRANAPVNTALLMARLKALGDERRAEKAKGQVPAEIKKDSSSGESLSKTIGTHSVPSEENSGLIRSDLQLDESQLAAIKKLERIELGCLIGAAGTGKTTIMRYVVHDYIYREKLITKADDVAFVAFTGTAAQVISRNVPEWLQGRCMTIHSYLDYAPEEGETKDGKLAQVFRPRKNKTNLLTTKVLFIDEASMLSVQLFKEIMDAKPAGMRIIMIGDLNQLPPIAGSSAFAFQLAGETTAELTTIHRQSNPKAQAIIDAAHMILAGKNPTFDDGDVKQFASGDWAVWGFKIGEAPQLAANQITSLLTKLCQARTIDGDRLYDPHRDRVMTPGNGYDTTTTASMVQQAPLNEMLAPFFDPPSLDAPLTHIDAGRSEKEFAVGFRVMATKNEQHGTKGRVTNGMLGRILAIKPNILWPGDAGLVGPVEKVKAEKARRIATLFNKKAAEEFQQERLEAAFSGADPIKDLMDGVHAQMQDPTKMQNLLEQSEALEETGRFAGLASHTVTVQFENGVTRDFVTQAQVDSLQLSYVTTVAKAQGAQHETVIVIMHHVAKSQLCRELLYTAVTRATRRVIMLYTDFGLTLSLSKQRIRGATLDEKIKRYQDFIARGGVM